MSEATIRVRPESLELWQHVQSVVSTDELTEDGESQGGAASRRGGTTGLGERSLGIN